ncbi:MAG TPA: M56 family metallopeptidase, partial [Isosphaeraceae bacterium]|nr:M56 family metallopeptidase [Isosphaeraceae bacterium]
MNLTAAIIPEWANPLIVAIGWALVLFLGQGFIIGLLVAAYLRTLRARSAALRYTVACAGRLLMALCPVVTTCWTMATSRHATRSLPTVASAVTLHDAAQAPAILERAPGERATATRRPVRADGMQGFSAASVGAPQAAGPPLRAQLEAWLPTIVAVWLVGVCVLALRLLVGLIEVRGISREGLLVPPEDVCAVIGRLVERAGLRRPVRWFLSVWVEVPSVVGWLRPTVLVPVASLARLTAQQVEALLAHEIAHILRHDYLVNVIQVAVESLLFFHPAVWWVSRRIRVERELCCDDRAVVLCGGDRVVLARALFALEEIRGARALSMAASGGSLRDRVKRLVAPTSDVPFRGGGGWVGTGVVVGIFAIVAMAWQAGVRTTRAAEPAVAGKTTIWGRVVDEKDQAVPGATIRLYRKDGRWERRHRLVEEVKSAADGSYRLTTPLEPDSLKKTGTATTFVLLADHPGLAVGWRTIPEDAASFEGEITLSEPIERTINVNGPDGKPMPGARVEVYSLGDATASEPYFRDLLSLRPEEGPLSTLSDARGHARFAQLPRTDSNFLAFLPDYAETFTFHGLDTIRLTRGASLMGTVTGPDGKPLAGVKVVLLSRFLYEFEFAVTDAEGRYHIDGLKANGWDMSAWGQNQKGNGEFTVWIDSEQYATPQKSITLQPYDEQTLNIQAQEA